MICAVVKDDIVQNVIVISEGQIEEMQKALDAELVDARPYGLAIGDLRTPRGWTRNAGGEQMLLPELEPEQYDSYTVAMKRAEQAEEKAQARAIAVISGEIEDGTMPALRGVRQALDRFIAGIADKPKALNENQAAIRAWTPGEYRQGDVRLDAGVPYRCVQAHDSSGNRTAHPASSAVMWAQVHGTSRETARVWVQPMGFLDAYQQGEWVNFKGALYESAIDANLWAPDVKGWEARS